MLAHGRKRHRGLIPVLALLGIISAASLAAYAAGSARASSDPDKQGFLEKSGDQELAYLLVKLEKQTRQVIAADYGREQAGGSEATATYKDYLVKNRILPAAVADPIFSHVVPGATGGRAWVRMVVPEPRNPNNRGDETALDMLAELKKGAPFVERSTPQAYYYGEPIQAKAGCLPCHGEPAGAPDPHFPQYKMNGWKAGDIIGGVIARVAPEG